MAIIDVFTYNGEADLLEIRLNILYDYVDQFIIIEAPTTFSGKPKPLYYEKEKARYKKWQNKIKYFTIDENYTEAEQADAATSPNTIGAAHWKHEYLQKESIKKALTHLQEEDIVFIGDVDEIWKTSSKYLDIYLGGFKLPLMVYTYYLNNRSTEQFWGTYVGIYGRDIKNKCLNHLRSDSYKLSPNLEDKSNYCGWHFTSMGGYKEVRRKLTDSYTEESYATHGIMDSLEVNILNRKDFLGRDFTYKIDESDWPEYLKANKEKYKHLMK